MQADLGLFFFHFMIFVLVFLALPCSLEFDTLAEGHQQLRQAP